MKVCSNYRVHTKSLSRDRHLLSKITTNQSQRRRKKVNRNRKRKRSPVKSTRVLQNLKKQKNKRKVTRTTKDRSFNLLQKRAE